MDNLEKVKCSKCGFMNIKGTRTCSKCNTNIESYKKSCPRCGKVNPNNVKRCLNCKFDFTKKRRSIWFNLIISIIVVLILAILVYFEKQGIVEKINIGFKVLAGLLILGMVITTFTLGSKEKINYSAEEDIIDNHEVFNKMKKRSNLAIVIGTIIILILLIIYYFVF